MTESDAARELRRHDPVFLRMEIDALTDALRETIEACTVLTAMAQLDAHDEPEFRAEMLRKASWALTRAVGSLSEVGGRED